MNADGNTDGLNEICFEPCVEHRGPTLDDPCGRCGWLAAEHTAGLAEVIQVPRRTTSVPMRRAS